MLVSLILPCVNAEVFDIGEEVDSYLEMYNFHAFTSGAYIRGDGHEVNLSHLIFDGNLSTGIDQNVTAGSLRFRLQFIYPLYVNNITIKPKFGNGSSNYSLDVLIYSSTFSPEISGGDEKFLQVNGFINGFILDIYPNGTDQFYFNDLIINYTPTNSFQDEIDDLTEQINEINLKINELNNSVNTLNLTPDEVNNITIEINDLNFKINELNNSINNLNLLTEEVNNISEQLNNLILDLNELNNTINMMNLTDNEILEGFANLQSSYMQLNGSFANLDSYLDSYEDRVLQLESENAAMSSDIHNLTEEIEKLKEDKDEPDDFVALGAFIFGILGILIAIVAVILATRKSEPEKPSEEKGESEGDEDKVNEEGSNT
jgi:predicted  nucleic acid-binding Zn-ribbon protein